MTELGSQKLILGNLEDDRLTKPQSLEIRRASVPALEGVAAPPLEPWMDEVRAVAGLQSAWKGLPSRRTLMFPVSASHRASMLAVRAAKILASLRRSTVLLVDLYTEGDRSFQIAEELQDLSSSVVFKPSVGYQAEPAPPGKPSVAVMTLAQEWTPLEFLASERFGEFMRGSAEWCSTVLVNGPSPRESAVSLLAAPHCNGCVPLVEEGVSGCEDIQEAGAIMGRAQCEVLGFLYLRTGKPKKQKTRSK